MDYLAIFLVSRSQHRAPGSSAIAVLGLSLALVIAFLIVTILIVIFFTINLFIYQARESSLVPAGFADSSVPAETLLYQTFETFELQKGVSALFAWRKGKV